MSPRWPASRAGPSAWSCRTRSLPRRRCWELRTRVIPGFATSRLSTRASYVDLENPAWLGDHEIPDGLHGFLLVEAVFGDQRRQETGIQSPGHVMPGRDRAE